MNINFNMSTLIKKSKFYTNKLNNRLTLYGDKTYKILFGILITEILTRIIILLYYIFL